MTSARPARRSMLVAAAVVAVCGLGFVWLGLTPGDGYDECPSPGTESGSYRFEPSLWPPGTYDCVVELPGGGERVENHVPWEDWLTVALIAAAAAVLAGARGTRRPVAAAAWGIALFLAAVLAWFIVDAAVWAALALLSVVSVVLVSRAAARR